jgi:hypothetical protein
MVKKNLTPVVLLCCLLIGLSACTRALVIGGAAAAVGVGSYLYIKGELERDYNAPMDRVWEATVQAVEELKLTTESKEHDAFGGQIKGKMSDGDSFKIDLKNKGDELTQVGIRIGTFGSKSKSEVIHDKIHAKLQAQ